MWKEGAFMMPLSMANIGEKVVIKRINGRDEIKIHLAELGFIPDSEVMIVNKVGKNFILQVKESRIAIDDSMANRIMI
ncbi:FeoA family protein [Eggerthia catenaformis]